MMMVENHTYHIKNHLLHRDTLKRAMMLIQSRHTFLSLSALRLLRKIIGKGDDTYNKLVVRVSPALSVLFLDFTLALERLVDSSCGRFIQQREQIQPPQLVDTRTIQVRPRRERQNPP